MRSIRSWFTEERASDVAPNYTDRILDAQLAAARGTADIRSVASYTGSLTLIGAAVGVATLSGQHSGALQGHLSTIATTMIATGESTWLINVGATGEVVLLPVTAAAVAGGPDPQSWLYTMTMPGPSETVTLQRPAESVLSFRMRADPKTPWRGRPAIDSTGTADLLCLLEAQMRAESKVSPARVVAGGVVAGQAGDISQLISEGGVVGIAQVVGSRDDPSGIRAGVVKNETSPSAVSLHQQLERAICGACGVPPGLVLGGGDGTAAREDFRRLASTTINNILTTISREWQIKLGTDLEWDLDRLRSSDEVSRARAVGSRAQAVSKLVDSGLPLNQALAVVGID